MSSSSSAVKSAFEILMNRTNRLKETKSPAVVVVVPDKTCTSDKNELIILNDSFHAQKEANNPPPVCTSASSSNLDSSSIPVTESQPSGLNDQFDPIFLHHERQYTDQDLKFIDELKNGRPNFKFKPEVQVPDIDSLIKTNGPSLLFDFTASTQHLRPTCDCDLSNPICTEFEKITFSLNSSLDSIAILDAFKSPEKPVRSSASFTQIDLVIGRPEFSSSSISCQQQQQDQPSDVESPSRDRYAKRRRTDLLTAAAAISSSISDTIKPAATAVMVSPVKRRGRGRPKKQVVVERIIEEEPIEDVAAKQPTPSPPPPQKKVDVSNDDHLLWTEKYQFKNENDIVTNNSQLERLKEWLTSWKSILSKDSSSIKTSKSWGGGSDSEDADYSCESDSDASSIASGKAGKGKKFYPNAIMLSGPHGCGKTSSVYAVAKQLGFKIFEVNASSLRCKSQIIQELEGAINSHHVSNNNNFSIISSSGTVKQSSKSPVKSQPIKIEKKTPAVIVPSVPSNKKKESMANSIRDFFRKAVNQPPPTKPVENPSSPLPIEITGSTDDTTESESEQQQPAKPRNKKRKNSLRRETVISAHQKSSTSRPQVTRDTPSTPSSSVKIHTESLILFDEIDVVFKEDVGFFAAINHFIKKSRKPIVLTTNDEFILTQAKTQVNLNVEKIRFSQPRVDAGVRFLKSVAYAEQRFDLDTSVAYKILNDCRCDMRRALIQLQTVVIGGGGSSSRLRNTGTSSHEERNLIDLYQQNAANSISNMYQSKNRHFFSSCKYHNHEQFFAGLFYLDKLTKKLGELYQLDCPSNNYTNESSAYDACVIKDGLSDTSSFMSSTLSSSCSWSASSTSSSATPAAVFNPFQSSQDNQYSKCKSVYVLSKHNTTYLKEELLDLYSSFVVLFNDHKLVEFGDWVKYGRVTRPGFAASSSLNRFAQSHFKFTSSPCLYLDYRPFLQEMCSLEESRQQQSASGHGSRRRFMHHLNSIGLSKEDLAMLAKSSLVEEVIDLTPSSQPDSQQQQQKSFFNNGDDVYEA